MPRGGKRKGAGRPSKAPLGTGALHYHRRRRSRSDEEDEGRGMTVEAFKAQFVNEIRKLRKQVRGGRAQVADVNIGEWQETGIDYALSHSLYEDWPLVRSAVDWAIDTVLENGYRTESEDTRAKELIDKFAQVAHIDDDVLPHWILAAHLDGDIFQELRWETVELDKGGSAILPTQLFALPADAMRYRWKDPKGTELLWTQFKGGRPIDGLENGFKQDFQHWSWRSLGANPYGTPIISSILDDVETLIKFQTDYREIIKWYVKPFWHVKVGTPEKPASDTLIKSVRDNWEDREPDTDLISAGNILIEEHGIGNKALSIEEYLTYHDNKQVDGLQSPFTHILRNANQASASEIRDNSLSRIVYIQRWLKRKLEEVFALILEKNNIQAIVTVSFQPLRAITLKDRIDRYIKLLDPMRVTLSKETRLEIEQRLRMELLDVPRDDSLVQINEPTPGQQGLFSRIRGRITGTPKPPVEEGPQEVIENG